MKTLDRYILRETLGPLLMALAIFTFLLAVRPVMEEAERLLAKSVPPQTIGVLLAHLLPQALGITIPMALLAGRFHVSTDDVRRMAGPALNHRLIRNFQGEMERISPASIVDHVVAATGEA